MPGTLVSVFAERVIGGNYLDFDIDRDAIARYGLTVGDVQDVIAVGDRRHEHHHDRRGPGALSGQPALQPRAARQPAGAAATSWSRRRPARRSRSASWPTSRCVKGPPAIKSENARPNAWIYVDIEGIDIGTYVRRRAARGRERACSIAGRATAWSWSGQYEYMQRAQQRLMYRRSR